MIALTDVEERNFRAVADVLEFWNRGDVPGVLNFYNDDIVWRNMGLDEVYRGKAEVGAFLTRLFTAFPDLNFSVSYKIARDKNVAEQWCIKGTHLGPFMGIPPTGRQVEIPGMSMVEMRDGKFSSDQFYFDAMGVMRQMGLFPPLSIGETPYGRAALWLMVNRKVSGGILAALALLKWRRGRKGRS